MMIDVLKKEIKRLRYAFIYSLQGLRAAFVDQSAFRLELIIFVVSIPLAFCIGKTAFVRGVLISSVLLLLIVEIINSAIETTINRISQDRHELSGRAKDLGSAAVLLAVLNVIVTWGFCFFGNS